MSHMLRHMALKYMSQSSHGLHYHSRPSRCFHLANLPQRVLIQNSNLVMNYKGMKHLNNCKVPLHFIILKCRYLNEPEIDHLSADPLAWWEAHCNAYPNIAILAKEYLAVPASSAPSERVFSTSKNIQQKKRWRLLPSRLEEIIFLKHNQAVFANI